MLLWVVHISLPMVLLLMMLLRSIVILMRLSIGVGPFGLDTAGAAALIPGVVLPTVPQVL